MRRILLVLLGITIGLLLLLGRRDTARASKRAAAAVARPVARPAAAEEPAAVVADAVPRASGSVVDERGDPVAGADVYMVPTESYTVRRGDGLPAVSGADGTFGFEGELADGHDLIVRKAGFVPAVRTAAEVDPGRELVVVLRAGASIVGQVATVSGSPVHGALARARTQYVHWDVDPEHDLPGRDGVQAGLAATDARGAFEVTGLDERSYYTIEVHAPGLTTEKTEWLTLWKRPPADVGTIRMVEVRGAIVGVRAGAIDCSLSVAWGRRGVRYPDGFADAFAGVPPNRFPSAAVARLDAAHRLGMRLLAKGDGSQRHRPPDETLARIALAGPDGTAAVAEVRLHPVGEDGWDATQWVELPPPAAGVGRIEATITGRCGPFLAIEVGTDMSDRPQVFPLREAGGVHAAAVPAAAYEVVRMLPRSLSRERYPVTVAAQETATVRLAFGRVPVLTVDPRLPSGAPARSLAMYLRRDGATGHTWLYKTYEPNGCRRGPEEIEITEELRGASMLVVRKTGFPTIERPVRLGDRDQLVRVRLAAPRDEGR